MAEFIFQKKAWTANGNQKDDYCNHFRYYDFAIELAVSINVMYPLHFLFLHHPIRTALGALTVYCTPHALNAHALRPAERAINKAECISVARVNSSAGYVKKAYKRQKCQGLVVVKAHGNT